jgi:2-hydroxychromene-2-carboxylate isomerase
MRAMPPVLYFDLGSPYAYLAVERADAVLGCAPELEPVLLGAIFRWRGSGSWARTDARAERIAEIEERARRYGLPRMTWPADWPADGLAAMRAATWAAREGRCVEFARAVFHRQFAADADARSAHSAGADITDLSVLSMCAGQAGLDPAGLSAAIEASAIKDDLRARTERAWEAGVRGIPSLRTAGTVYYGDDSLEAAARAARAAPTATG